MLLWTFQLQLWTSVFIRISSNYQQKFLVLRKIVQHLWQLKLTYTSTHWARKHITEFATGQKPSIRIFTFLPQVPLTQDLRARLHPIRIQHLGAPSPFSRDMSFVERRELLTLRVDQYGRPRGVTKECFLRPQKPSSRSDPQYEVKACHVRYVYTSHNAFRSSVAQVYNDSSNFHQVSQKRPCPPNRSTNLRDFITWLLPETFFDVVLI